MSDLFRHALVIGKFYPPHRGHEYLIRTAASSAHEVTVVVMAADIESIALALRVAWLKEIVGDQHNVRVVGVVDNVRVDYDDESIWSQHVALMEQGMALAERRRGSPAGPIDAVFTSEHYGDELGRRLNAVPVCLDESRTLFPVSGTAVRRDPIAHWHLLAPCVREHLSQRVVVVGAESTGKSTLCAALAAKVRGRGGVWARSRWVEEFGREYTVNKLAIERARARQAGQPTPSMEALQWRSPEFVVIAKEQQRRENEAAREAGPLVICDTDAFATAVWHERYLGERSATVEAIAASAPPRFGYIVTSCDDVPFEQDGLRDGEHIRGWMHEAFISRLKQQSAPWTLVSGTLEQRLEQSLEWLDARMPNAWRFTAPLG